MTDKDLRKLLEKVQGEIEQTQTMDERGRKLLRNLDGDIRKLLERSGETEMHGDASVLEQLQDTIDHMEVTHPDLTMMLSELMTILSNAGI
jgi:uncharacterized protein DUF4404